VTATPTPDFDDAFGQEPATQTAAWIPPSIPQRSTPVGEDDRFHAMDVLRGFALLGILILNIQFFAMPGAAYMNPTAYGDLNGNNYRVWWFSHVFCDQKFMTIFSMLFGAGIVLMTSRAEAKTGRSAAVHYRRMGWLILFGLVHAHLIWPGDILYTYGVCGLLVWLARKWKPVVQIALGAILISVASAISFGIGLSVPHWPAEAIKGFAESWTPSAEVLQKEIDAYQGGWFEQQPQRMLAAAVFQTMMFAVWSFWRVTGLMLVGMALYRMGVFQARRSVVFYAAMAIVGLGVGLMLSSSGVRWNEARDWALESSFFYGMQWNYWGSLFASLGYVGVVMLACKSVGLIRLLKPLGAVGQMALTNYLMQSVICTTIFYGHGFGQFGQFERVDQAKVVVGVWLIQLIVSPIWLAMFRFGPAEWLWRSLTYWNPQPMLRRAR
jgi:uncharacterized protein